MSRLPKYWATIPLNELCDRIVDGSHNPPKATEVGWPMLSARNINNHQIVFDDYRLISEKDFWNENARTNVASGDVLLTIVGTIGRTAVIPDTIKPFALQRSVAVLKPRGVINKFLAYALDSPSSQKWLFENAKGTAQKGVYLAKLGTIQMPLAPEREQIRIVEKLEELLSDLDAGVAELKAAQKKLTQYRQSLLKAAVEGTLTAEWRAERAKRGESLETGAQLLEHILTERRRCWEEKQLAKFKEQGKTPPKDWRDKYPEPVKPNTAGLPELPEGWVWVSAGCLIAEIETGKSFKCDERPPTSNEIGVVKVSSVSWGEYDEQESKTCTDLDRVNEVLFVRPGDFLFSRANTIELVGACVIASTVTLRVMLSDKILRFIFVVDGLNKWLLFLLRSDLGRFQIEALASGNQESMRNIGQERIRQIAVPLPPPEEIEQILVTLDQCLEAAFTQAKTVEYGLKQSSAQRQNILKAAFSGQLVPQDPNDEPASVLLERIRAERAARESGGRRRGRKAREDAA